MANRTLGTSYLVRLSNSNHDGVTQQICDRLRDFETENQMLIQAVAAVHAARQTEDAAYRRFSGKDFASDDLKAADQLEDKYMSTIHNILNALLYLPETEPLRRKAQMAVQLYKDFNFSTNDGYEAEARKTVNMVQQWMAATEYTLAELGIQEWVTKAHQNANNVLQLVAVRVENESAKVKGELANARKATDAAIRQAYDVLNALCVLQPSAQLTQLMSLLFGVEDRAKLYYISGATVSSGEIPTYTGGGGTPSGSGSGSGTISEGGSTGGGGESSGSGSGNGESDSGSGNGSDSGSGGNNSGNQSGSGDDVQSGSYRLVIYKYGSGTSTVTNDSGQELANDSNIASGSIVNIRVVPAAGKVPTAVINGNTNITLTESNGTYSGSFQMPTKGTVLEVNSEPSDMFDSGS